MRQQAPWDKLTYCDSSQLKQSDKLDVIVITSPIIAVLIQVIANTFQV